MEYLRQGLGIIDLVNTYAEVALFYGLCGLSLFVGFILVGLYKAFRLARINLHSDPDLASLGISLVACILGTLVMISSDSFGWDSLRCTTCSEGWPAPTLISAGRRRRVKLPRFKLFNPKGDLFATVVCFVALRFISSAAA